MSDPKRPATAGRVDTDRRSAVGSDTESAHPQTADTILARLAGVAKLIESHRTAIYLLEIERLELQGKLRATEWQAPAVPA